MAERNNGDGVLLHSEAGMLLRAGSAADFRDTAAPPGY